MSLDNPPKLILLVLVDAECHVNTNRSFFNGLHGEGNQLSWLRIDNDMSQKIRALHLQPIGNTIVFTSGNLIPSLLRGFVPLSI